LAVKYTRKNANMATRLIRHLRIPLLLVTLILAVILPVTSVFAIDPPDAITLLGCNAYEDVIEEGDMFFLMHYNLDYAVYPTDETVNSSFYTTLTNAGTGVDIALSDIFTNPYFNDGFGQGINSMYFTSAEVSALGLTWGAGYNMRIVPNATCNWTGGGIPAPVSQAVTWSTSGLEQRVLFIMNRLQNQWGVNLLDSGTLSVYGENYGISTIPNLRLMAPTIFVSYNAPIEYGTERAHGLTYALTLRNQWIGTWLDLTTPAADWGVDAMWLYGGIWLIAMVGVSWIAATVGSRMQGVEEGVIAQSTKPLLFLNVLMIIWGGLMGFLPRLDAVLAGFVLVIIMVNQIFFSKASA
jgi:hypothetical protein